MSGKENRNAWRKPASSTTDHIWPGGARAQAATKESR
jgi:hypothetical protein